jgi:multiple sugar transport system permease protein
MVLRAINKSIIYLLLVTGAVVFSFPFLWMAATSVKVDREVKAKELELFPMTPRPRQVSPYVDDRYFAELEGPFQDTLLPRIARIVHDSGFRLPPDINREVAETQIARGLYSKLRRRLSDEVWKEETQVADAAAREITAGMAEEVFRDIHRRLCVGSVRIRDYNRTECELGKGDANGIPAGKRLGNQTPQVATLVDQTDREKSFASVNYDFGAGQKVVLSRTFDVPGDFDLGRLHKIQLDLRPDDTWHELWLTVEKLAVRYEADRAVPLANFNWMMVTWQEPGPDDDSTKLKTWVRLNEVSRGAGVLNEPGRIKLTFEFRRSGQAGAWMNKIKLNYNRVLDQMPFWRYVSVSLFLVIVNVVLAVLVSSLVAYAFARLNWPGREFCFILMLATMMIPGQVTMIPHFLIWKTLGAYNTLTPLWLGSAFGSAFFIFLLRQFLRGVPRDLEDAARIDGCGFLRIYWHIMLPLVKPSLAAIAIFTFMGTWNDFMGPLLYIADQRLYPLSFGLYAFSVQVANDPALTMAASLLMTVPVILIFFFAQKYFIQGVTLTGMKG